MTERERERDRDNFQKDIVTVTSYHICKPDKIFNV